MDRVAELTQAYQLAPHPEGGAFAEVYTAPFSADGRPTMGSIYFLLDGADVSHFHRIDCDELWYYHEGCGMRVTVIDARGSIYAVLLGPDPQAGQAMMICVPAGCMFAAQNLDAASYTFVSCATSPKFRAETFELIRRSELRRICPQAPEALYALAYE